MHGAVFVVADKAAEGKSGAATAVTAFLPGAALEESCAALHSFPMLSQAALPWCRASPLDAFGPLLDASRLDAAVWLGGMLKRRGTLVVCTCFVAPPKGKRCTPVVGDQPQHICTSCTHPCQHEQYSISYGGIHIWITSLCESDVGDHVDLDSLIFLCHDKRSRENSHYFC